MVKGLPDYSAQYHSSEFRVQGSRRLARCSFSSLTKRQTMKIHRLAFILSSLSVLEPVIDVLGQCVCAIQDDHASIDAAIDDLAIYRCTVLVFAFGGSGGSGGNVFFWSGCIEIRRNKYGQKTKKNIEKGTRTETQGNRAKSPILQH